MPEKNLYEQLLAQSSSQQYSPLRDGGNLYEQLLEKGDPKEAIHNVLHQLMLEDIKQQRLYEKKSFAGKIIWHSNRFLNQYKMYRAPQNLTSKGLCLLKTQFAKKPKNPV